MHGSRLLVLLCVLVHATAFAQSTSEAPRGAREKASTHFRRGVELYQDEAYRAALVEFERAYGLSPDYRLLYNIGQTKLELQDFLGAARAYESYLSEGGSSVPHEQREEVEEALQALQRRVGRISLTVNREGAEVFLDDQKVGTTPLESALMVNVGQHRIVVRAPDGATETRVVDVAGYEIAELSLTLSTPQPTRVVEEKRRLAPMRKVAIAGWASGGALLVGAVVTGVLAKSADKDLDRLMGQANVDAGVMDDQRSTLKARALTTDVLVGAGAALAVTGTVLWIFGRDEERAAPGAAARLRFGVGPAALSVRGRF